ncbi:MAG TPA: hypothetical protein VFT47_00440 [Vicinamibacterales bacterium]|nr:hypothetical protein [Vicinamibacterales bacterium]
MDALRRESAGGGLLIRSGGTAVFVGPTALLLYKAYGLEGGVMFPVYQNTKARSRSGSGLVSTSATSSG